MASVTTCLTAISKSCLVQVTVHPTLYYTAPPRRPIQHFQTQTLIPLNQLLQRPEPWVITHRLPFITLPVSRSLNSVNASCLGAFVLCSVSNPAARPSALLASLSSGIPFLRLSLLSFPSFPPLEQAFTKENVEVLSGLRQAVHFSSLLTIFPHHGFLFSILSVCVFRCLFTFFVFEI